MKKVVNHDQLCFSDLVLVKISHKCSSLSLEFEY